ncbi:hypothetical protein [Acuticoccus yangtzensis]|uniref:hypothetical protein n=1 Tax=Acuticoccus yangtzensis TaxID=1443441 RepID=UPI0009494FBB|nr:hypothetical protein [Acuticoccus yangtzensis]
MTIKVNTAKLSIGTAAAAHLTDTYKVIDGLNEMGAISGERKTSQVANINTGELITYETSYDPGSMECKFIYLAGDVGQAALEAAHASGGEFNFLYTLSNNTKIYWRGFISRCALAGGGEEDTEMLDVTITRVKGIPVKVPAA